MTQYTAMSRGLITSAGIHQELIYHFLSRPFGQEVSVPKIVDFDIFDIVAVGNVHLAVDSTGSGRAAGVAGTRRRRPHRGNIDMLDALASL